MSQRLFYLPWIDGVNTYEKGIQLGKAIATELGIGRTFVVPSKNHLHPSLNRENVVTPRSGSGSYGSLKVLLFPDMRMGTRFLKHRQSPLLVVEHLSYKFDSWAKIHGAFNLQTSEIMQDERPSYISKIHASIVDLAYNGLFSPPSSDVIDASLRELSGLGWLDEVGIDYLVGALIETCSDDDLGKLRKRVAKIAL